MLGIYYGNAWGSRSLPFMSTRLLTQDGKQYPSESVFIDGILDEKALLQYGLPRITGTFAYAMFMANAAVSFLPPNTQHWVLISLRLAHWSLILFSFGVAIQSERSRMLRKESLMIPTTRTWPSITRMRRNGGILLYFLLASCWVLSL